MTYKEAIEIKFREPLVTDDGEWVFVDVYPERVGDTHILKFPIEEMES